MRSMSMAALAAVLALPGGAEPVSAPVPLPDVVVCGTPDNVSTAGLPVSDAVPTGAPPGSGPAN
jgi:hypothetical protein